MQWCAISYPMLFKLRSRGSFIAAIVLLQSVVVGLGWVGATHAARDGLRSRVRERVIEENSRAVSHLCAAVSSIIKERPEPGKPAWEEVQRLVSRFTLPGSTSLVVLSEQGEVIFPTGRNNNETHNEGRPGAREGGGTGAGVSNPVLTLLPGGEKMLLSELNPGAVVSAKAKWGATGIGRAEGDAGDEGDEGESVLSVVYSTRAGMKFVAAAPQAVVDAAERELASDVTLWVGLAGVVVLCITIGGSVVLVRRYDAIVMRMNRQLEQEAERRTRRGLAIRNGLVFGLAKLADYRDTDTGKHLERICRYCELLAQKLVGVYPEIDKAWIERLKLASSMHDIGKVGIPDSILLKPGKLTPEERNQMETHAVIGADTLMAIRQRVGDDDLLNMSVQVALCHHEKVDGTGYPNKLVAGQIPLCARIVALADVYDALTSVRVYKPAMSHAEAVAIIAKSRGTHFDPVIADAFMAIHPTFDAICEQLQGRELAASLRAAA